MIFCLQQINHNIYFKRPGEKPIPIYQITEKEDMALISILDPPTPTDGKISIKHELIYDELLLTPKIILSILRKTSISKIIST